MNMWHEGARVRSSAGRVRAMQHTKLKPRRPLLDNPKTWNAERGTFEGPYDDAAARAPDAVLAQPLQADVDSFDSPSDHDYVPLDPDMAAPIFETAQIAVDDDAWLRGAWRESGALCVLEISEEREVVINVPAYGLQPRVLGGEAVRVARSQQVARMNPFSKLRLRLLEFSDQVVVAAVCDNPGCNRSPDDAAVISDAVKMGWHVHRTMVDVIAGRDPLCRCAHVAVSLIWREGVGSPADAAGGLDEQTFCAWLREQDPQSALEQPCVRIVPHFALCTELVVRIHAGSRRCADLHPADTYCANAVRRRGSYHRALSRPRVPPQLRRAARPTLSAMGHPAHGAALGPGLPPGVHDLRQCASTLPCYVEC